MFGAVACLLGLSNLLLAESARVPVLLELFTSEGCSSCPPADALLENLDREQPIAGADLIVLSEHVDYWNQLGWRDPFSSAAFSARQNDYASKIDASDVYTPELVVDGTWGVVGSRRSDIEKTIEKAAQRNKQRVHIDAKRDGDSVSARVDVEKVSGVRTKRLVYAVVARNRVTSRVGRGENASRTLAHVAVAYEVMKIGLISGDTALSKSVELKLPPQSAETGIRVVVFIQEEKTGHIAGVAQARL
jgi:hypothetical protein